MKNKTSLIYMFLGAVALTGILPLLKGATQNRAIIQERLGGTDGFNPSSQQPLVYRQDDGTILRTSGKPNDFQLSIARPGTQAVAITLPDDIVQLNSISGARGNEAVVIGMVNSSVAEVVIVATLNCRIADQFLAYEPTISPNGQFIAFIRFYPPHFVQGTSDDIMVYDLTRSPGSNRPGNAALSDDTNVGMAVYPRGIQTETRNTELPEADTSHVSSKTFFWAPDSSKFLFSIEHLLMDDQNTVATKNAKPKRAEVSLVLVNLAASHDTTAVGVFPAITCTARGGSCEQLLNSVEFGEDSVKAQFQGFGSNAGRQQLLQVKYDQFHVS